MLGTGSQSFCCAMGSGSMTVSRGASVTARWLATIDLGWPAAQTTLLDVRGAIDAVGLCAEIGDFERFARAEQLMSYIGVVPSESTTGQQRRLGSITKTGAGPARP